MGIYYKKQFGQSSTVGLWEITETLDFLYKNILLNEEEIKSFSYFKNELRKLHWLSYRNLLKEIISPKDYSHVVYDDNGKPFLSCKSHHLSVSHSGKFSAAIISNKYPVGIDIEKIHPRIEKLACKFLSEKELSDIDKNNKTEMLQVYWGAKEALYKLYGMKELLFPENIFIKPFEYNNAGEIEGEINTKNFSKKYTLFYERIENYMLVHVTDDELGVRLWRRS
ncbi:MAG: 4'-phosphopantetheinyl transferase superfamily protein [Bacteroidetes bacterium]|nr:4'-phosphopantetheinyl transferase superfamily protein [Bacteroidota bacterium]